MIQQLTVNPNYYVGNQLTWVWTGVGPAPDVRIYARSNANPTRILLATIPVSNQVYLHETLSYICLFTVTYELELDDGNQIIDASFTYTNNCFPEEFPTVTRTCQASAVALSWPAHSLSSNSVPYTVIRIYRSENGNAYNPIAELNVSTTSYTDNTVQLGNIYTYRLAYVLTPPSTVEAERVGLSYQTNPCFISPGPCGKNGIITQFAYDIEAVSCAVNIKGLIGNDGSYIIPVDHACDNINEILYHEFVIYKPCEEQAPSSGFHLLDLNSQYFDGVNLLFKVPFSEKGVYAIKLRTVYTDFQGKQISLFTTKYFYIDCEIECLISDLFKRDKIKATQAIIYNQAIHYNTKCNDGTEACNNYEILLKYLSDCNCV